MGTIITIDAVSWRVFTTLIMKLLSTILCSGHSGLKSQMF